MLLKDGTILVLTILIQVSLRKRLRFFWLCKKCQNLQGWSIQPAVSSESVSGDDKYVLRWVDPFLSFLTRRPSAGMGGSMDSSYNRVAGLAMHPVGQRNGVEDRKGGGTTVADTAPPSAFRPIFLILLPLALLLLHWPTPLSTRGSVLIWQQGRNIFSSITLLPREMPSKIADGVRMVNKTMKLLPTL